MAIIGKLLENRRAGPERLAWNAPNPAAAQTLALHSADFEDQGTIPTVHAGKRAGGTDLSPALTWSPAPEGTAQWLPVIEDPDAPTPTPFVHCVALLEPGLSGIGHGALDDKSPSAGVRILRSDLGRGYRGPAPIKGHGPHRYAFQLFALAEPVAAAAGGRAPDAGKPRDVIASADKTLARGRLDGFCERR